MRVAGWRAGPLPSRAGETVSFLYPAEAKMRGSGVTGGQTCALPPPREAAGSPKLRPARYLIEITVGPRLPKSHGGGTPDATKVFGHANTLTVASAVPFLNGGLAGKKLGCTRTVAVLTVGVGVSPSSQMAVLLAKPKPSAVSLPTFSWTVLKMPLDMKTSHLPVLGSNTG